MGAKYCSQHLSCLSVCSHISKTTRPNFTNFSVYVIRGRGLVFVWWQCNTSGFGDVIFSHSGAHFTFAFVTGCLTASHSLCNSFYVCLCVFPHLWTMHRAKSAILDCLVLICYIICIQNNNLHSSDKAFQLYTLFHATAWYLPSYTVITAVFFWGKGSWLNKNKSSSSTTSSSSSHISKFMCTHWPRETFIDVRHLICCTCEGRLKPFPIPHNRPTNQRTTQCLDSAYWNNWIPVVL